MLQTAKMIDTSTVKCNSSSPNVANQCQDCTEKSNHKHIYHHTEPTDQESIQEAGFPKVQTLRPRVAPQCTVLQNARQISLGPFLASYFMSLCVAKWILVVTEKFLIYGHLYAGYFYIIWTIKLRNTIWLN
jgi:hypothetical protein